MCLAFSGSRIRHYRFADVKIPFRGFSTTTVVNMLRLYMFNETFFFYTCYDS